MSNLSGEGDLEKGREKRRNGRTDEVRKKERTEECFKSRNQRLGVKGKG